MFVFGAFGVRFGTDEKPRALAWDQAGKAFLVAALIVSQYR